MMNPVWTSYHKRVSEKEIEFDEAQEGIIRRLDQLVMDLSPEVNQQRGGLHIFGLTRRPKVPQRGLYIYGSVGAGKTMLMDLFFQCVKVKPKQRLHFHSFMEKVHDRIARGRLTTEGDPIPYVAREIAGETMLLCFDEFHVTDIADAMILGRLFKGLFERGVIVVATSNVAPDKLYWNGLNRSLFAPFIELIEKHLDVVSLNSHKDYRIEKLVGQDLYFCPLNEHARSKMDRHWDQLTNYHTLTPAQHEYKGRKILIPMAARGVARFQFQDLCGIPLGSGDYLELVRHYHTFLIEGIPVLSPDLRNEARRLINLIDTLYDQRVCLIVSAAAEPHALYTQGDGADLFKRTASRLLEMRSEAYLKSCFSQKESS